MNIMEPLHCAVNEMKDKTNLIWNEKRVRRSKKQGRTSETRYAEKDKLYLGG